MNYAVIMTMAKSLIYGIVHDEAGKKHSHDGDDSRVLSIEEFYDIPYLEGEHDANGEDVGDSDAEEPAFRGDCHIDIQN